MSCHAAPHLAGEAIDHPRDKMKVSSQGNDQPRRPEDELPIDINYTKFADWLTDRQKIKNDWRNSLRLIQQKVQTAVQNLPDNPQLNEVKKGINVADMNYVMCKRIRDVLTSDKDTAQKNWLGQYKSQATKDWEAILRLYDKDNVHLAEAAHILYQNVVYEIPALRKIIQACMRQQQDLHRKESEYNKGSQEYRAKYEQECAKLGIKGEDVRSELLERSKELPNIYLSVIEAIRDAKVSTAREVYAAFVGFSIGAADNTLDVLPLIREIHWIVRMFLDSSSHIHPDFEYEEAESADPPSMEQLERIAFADDAVTMEDMQKMLAGGQAGGDGGIDWGDAGGGAGGGDAGVIDWGGMDAAGDSSGGIDWGAAGGGGEAGGDGGIDWGDAGGGGAGQGSGGDVGIDWGDGSAGEAGGDSGIDWGAGADDLACIEVEAGGNEGVVEAGGAECLKSSEGRGKLANELLELQTFLEMRFQELQSDEYVAVNTSQDLPAIVQSLTTTQLKEILAACRNCVTMLNSPSTQHFIMVRSSPKFLTRLSTSISQRLQNANKLYGCIDGCVKRRADLDDTIATTQPKLQALIQSTRSVKKSAEEIMTQQLQGRRVNIIGDINTVLSG